ncbi:N-methyl-D-aspartate receptor NMDAR2C subunit [Aquabacterium sp.]|uniref:HD domain-containing protein n=1 Tax=Aquabacterium sp. TaxID=1872578 RepID=UPI0037843BA6
MKTALQRIDRNWFSAWPAIGARQDDGQLLNVLLACYAEPHRAYHTQQHLRECLAWLQRLQAHAGRPAEIAIALWFHDAIYRTDRHDNEARCADWARAAVWAAGGEAAAAERIHALVLATQHDAQPGDADAQLLVDIDLAILGAPERRFDQYERQVRQEYAAVPEAAFRQGRRRILEAFLARPRLYATPAGQALFEARARRNLQRSITALR